jgi:hypothetical protein
MTPFKSIIKKKFPIIDEFERLIVIRHNNKNFDRFELINREFFVNQIYNEKEIGVIHAEFADEEIWFIRDIKNNKSIERDIIGLSGRYKNLSSLDITQNGLNYVFVFLFWNIVIMRRFKNLNNLRITIQQLLIGSI